MWSFLFIHVAGLVYHRRAKCGTYHQERLAALVSHHAPACICLRLDDIQGYVLLYLQRCDIIYTESEVHSMSDSKLCTQSKVRKIIIICIFLMLILATAIYTIVSAVNSYNYDMNPANGVDIMEGLDAVLVIMVGGFVVFYELDLFYTVYYFFIKPKTPAKTILNCLSNLSLLLIFFANYYKNIFEEDVIAPLLVFLIYIILRISCFILSTRTAAQE